MKPRNMTKFDQKLAVLALPALLAACAGAPPAAAPDTTMELPVAAAAAQQPVRADWWTLYGDAQLNALVAEALANNTDLARAAARIDESRALVRLARADALPSVGATAGAARQRSGANAGLPAPVTANNFNLGLNVSWEVDLWGRLAAGSRAAREDLAATTLDRDALRTALAAQVVQAYAAVQAIDAQTLAFREAVVAQRDGARLQRLREQGGELSPLDLRQIEAELAGNESQLLKLERARGETSRALAVLLGRSPRAVWDAAIAAPAQPLAVAGGVPAGLPSTLLEQRPDVAAAEARLRAAGARVDVARAAYLPGVSLSASLGKASTDLSNLLDGPSTLWSLVASLTQPIWNAGRLDAGREAVLARQRQAELDYRDAVARAFREVRDALDAQAEASASLALARQRADALRQAARLTQLRVDAGESSRLNAIDAERIALAAQSQLADQQRALAAAQADVFRALGGGWVAESSSR
jgi:multidrug efflux system outer membrane protein